jgi:hypothetical protein
MAAIDDLIPRWTKRVVTDAGGRDPLGLSRVGFLITDYLLTGIITTTDRARYYSFYCWVLWHIEREDAPVKYEDFVAGFRRREAALAVATIANNPSTSPVGVEATRIQFEKGKSTGFLDTDFKVLPSNSLGGYGQYYAGSIYHMHLSHRSAEGMDRVSPGVAEQLAQSFQNSIENTPYIKNKLYSEREIPVKDLLKSKEFLTLDALNEPFAAEEKRKLLEIFFDLNEEKKDDKTLLRRQTLIYLLYILDLYNKNGSSVDAANYENLDEYLLYSLYYGVLWLEDEVVVPFEKLESFSFCESLWRQFCVHQFLIQALELLLSSVIETAGQETGGDSLENIIENFVTPEFFVRLTAIFGEDSSVGSPFELLNSIGIDKLPTPESSVRLREELLPDKKGSEAQILDLPAAGTSGAAAQAVALLAVIYGKWRGDNADAGINYLARHAGPELWILKVFPVLDTWFEPQITWLGTFAALIDVFVLQQHDRIMYEKRRLDSCWLRRTDGRIFREQDYRPVWRASRFYNATKIMTDLGLIKVDERKLEITAEGADLLNQLV